MVYDRSILSLCRENCYCPCCFVENLLIIIYLFLSEYFEVILLCLLWKYMYIKNKDKKKLNHHRRHFRWHCRTWTDILISSAVLCFGVGQLSKNIIVAVSIMHYWKPPISRNHSNHTTTTTTVLILFWKLGVVHMGC